MKKRIVLASILMVSISMVTIVYFSRKNEKMIMNKTENNFSVKSESEDQKTIYNDLKSNFVMGETGHIEEICLLEIESGRITFLYSSSQGDKMYYSVAYIKYDELMKEKISKLEIGNVVSMEYAGSVQESDPETYLDLVHIEKLGEASDELINTGLEILKDYK